MKEATRHAITVTAVLLVLAAGLGVFAWSGYYNVAADDPHTTPVYRALETMRERSIRARAMRIAVPPDLAAAERIRQGAGNYDAMCMDCHLAPGMTSTELSRGLYPAPPDLSRVEVDAAQAFWTIKHGIKASGMPGWGGSMDDGYIWNLVAFVQALPEMTPEAYRTAVAASDGHSHGGGESGAHDHGTGMTVDHHHAPGAAMEDHPHPPGTPADHHATPEASREPEVPRKNDAGRVPAPTENLEPQSEPRPGPEPKPEPEAHDDGHEHHDH
jgi:mono/diheme cytochrome c family protein